MTARAALALAGLRSLAGCAGVSGGPAADACSLDDGALAEAAFTIATAPTAGARVASGFPVAGCSRTFESTGLGG